MINLSFYSLSFLDLGSPALRHSFASRALARGRSLTMIGRLLDHRHPQTTARYAHLAPHSVKSAAENVADSLLADIDTPPSLSA